MTRVKTLKELCQSVLRYVGNGYVYYKITHIPLNKAHKTAQILNKVSKTYETTLSQGKRQYKRKQKKANYQSISFRGMIIIFRTSGEHKDNQNEFKKIDSRGLFLTVSEYLELILFKDERDKWTYRLSKENYTFFSQELKKSYEKKDGIKYHHLKRMFNHLPPYKGIGKQKKELNNLIRELQNTYKTRRYWGLF